MNFKLQIFIRLNVIEIFGTIYIVSNIIKFSGLCYEMFFMKLFVLLVYSQSRKSRNTQGLCM